MQHTLCLYPKTYVEFVQVYVDTPSGKTLVLKLKTTDTIENIKAIIEDKKGIHPNQQQLIFDGEWLENYCTISDCNIENESTLQLECM